MGKAKKIGINTLFLIPNRVGGTEYYTRSFLDHLQKQDKINSYVIFCNKENYDTFDFKNKNWDKVLCPISAQNRIVRILYEQIILPFVVSVKGCSLLHSFGYFGPVFGNFRKIISVHDANWKDCPEDVSPFQILILNILISMNILVADKITTDSDFSKSRLIHYFPGHRGKIIVIPGAIEDEFIRLLKTKNGPVIKGKYLLCVSKYYPHKKIPYLIHLFKKIERKNNELKLALVGRDGTEEKLVRDLIRNDKRIIQIDKVKYPFLVNLYKNAAAFIFPSVYEGFGYPVYEAAAAGIPIFVGKRELYQNSIQKHLTKLAFNDTDVVNVINGAQGKTYEPVNSGYNVPANKLKEVYSSLNK